MLTKALTQTFWHKIVEQFTAAQPPVIGIEVKKGLDNPSSPANTDSTDIEPIVHLWILRLLVPLECHRKLITPRGYASDEMTQLLGLNVYITDDGEEIELSDTDKPLADKVPKPQKYDEQQARRKLIHLHAEAERNAVAIALPQPLADNLRQLTEQVGLSPIEAQILAFAVLIRTDRVLNKVGRWIDRDLNSLNIYHLLSVLLEFSVTEIREALATHSVLSKTALVVLQRDYSNLDDKLNVLSSGFADRLVFEEGSPIDWLRDMVIPSQMPQLALSDYPHIKGQLDFLLPYLQQALSTQRKGVNVFLYGTPGTGKTQLTRVLAQQLGMPLYEIASEDEDGDPVDGVHRLRAFRTAQAFFEQTPTLMLFDEVEDVFNDGGGYYGEKSTAQTRKAWMNRLLEENPVPTFWLGNSIHSVDPAFIRRFDWVLELPVPPKTQREKIIRDHCSHILTDPTIKNLAACEELAPAVVTRAAQVIGTLTEQFPAEQLSTVLQEMMDKTLQAQGHAGLNADNSVRLPDCYDPDLINCDADVKQIAAGIQRNGSARICLFGVPGTGKTAYARWLAEQLDKPLHVKRGADLLSMWVGGTEQNIARIFKQAEQEQAVLLIDEVDSFLQDRGNSRHSWEITAVNEMLTRMESYNGVFIASTNRMEGLDSAALRRFDLKVKFDTLKPAQAWQLLQSHCQALGLAAPAYELQIALQKLDNLTLGDFAVLARQHRFSPFEEANALIKALQAECALKTPYQKPAIGFV